MLEPSAELHFVIYLCGFSNAYHYKNIDRGGINIKFTDYLIKEEETLNHTINYAKEILRMSPEGSLRINKNGNVNQYYLMNSSVNRNNRPEAVTECIKNKSDRSFIDSHGSYIRKSNMDLIRRLAQKDYARKLLEGAEEEKNKLVKFMTIYNPNRAEELYELLSASRKELVLPYIMPEQDYVAAWEKEEYIPKKIEVDEDFGMYTEKGEAVRSKSEKILADKFYLMNIPYHYEKPLVLQGYGTVYPDFVVLNKRERREYIWEHFGMMDDQEYAEKAIKKIELYERNGYYNGDGLIITFETQYHTLNIQSVENKLKKYLY